MRHIEKEMLTAIRCRHNWHKDNTTVEHQNGVTVIRLHGNHIATIDSSNHVSINTDTLHRWPTPTTKSRLRALNVPVYTKNYETFIGNVPLNKYEDETFALNY